MRNILTGLFCILICSCSSQKFIYYKYNDVTITRLDDDNRISYFYYGFYDKAKSCPNNYIKAEYPRGTDLMQGYLVFQKNKSVDLVVVGDDFTQIGTDTMLRIKEINDNSVFGTWMISIDKQYDNVAMISDALHNEMEDNNANNSKVHVTYH